MLLLYETIHRVCSFKGSDSPSFPPQEAELSLVGFVASLGMAGGVTELSVAAAPEPMRTRVLRPSSRAPLLCAALPGSAARGYGERQQKPGVKGRRSDASRCRGGVFLISLESFLRQYRDSHTPVWLMPWQLCKQRLFGCLCECGLGQEHW